MKLFDKQVQMAEEARLIKKATLKPQLSNSAERIAAIVNAERPTNPATLCDLVSEETVNNTTQLESEIQLLKSQIENIMSGKSKKKNPPIQHPRKGNHTSSNASGKTGRASTMARLPPRRIMPPVHNQEEETTLQAPPPKTKGPTHQKENPMGKRPPPTRKGVANFQYRA